MNCRKDCHTSLGLLTQKVDNPKCCRRVKSARWLIKEKHGRLRDHFIAYRRSLPLTARNTRYKPATDQLLWTGSQSHHVDSLLNGLLELLLIYILGIDICREWKEFADCLRCHQHVILLYECSYFAKVALAQFSIINYYCSINDWAFRYKSALRQSIQQRCLSRTTRSKNGDHFLGPDEATRPKQYLFVRVTTSSHVCCLR